LEYTILLRKRNTKEKSPLNNQYTLKKMKDRKIKQVLFGYQKEGGGQKEREKEGEHGCALYSYIKIEQ
jgi:hypothetical protein